MKGSISAVAGGACPSGKGENGSSMTNNRCSAHIFANHPTPLEGLDSHDAIDCIKRFAPAGFPVHIGIHQVSVAEGCNGQIYSAPHAHRDEDEVNILISDGSLVYRMTLDDESYEVSASVSIWIPAGVMHSANVISGQGTFICLRFPRQPGAAHSSPSSQQSGNGQPS